MENVSLENQSMDDIRLSKFLEFLDLDVFILRSATQ